jgi:hypothetical protein
MRAKIIVTALLAAGSLAPAFSATPVFVSGELAASKDSAGFETQDAGIGAGVYLSDENFVDRLGYRKMTRKFSAPGFSTRANVDTLFAAKSLPAAYGTMKAEGEVTRFRTGQYGALTLGALQLAGTIPSGVNYEARFEKNIVESAASLANSVTYNAYTVAADYEVTPRFVLAGLAGRFNFSDDNQRSLVRAKAIYVLSEEYGVSAYVRARGFSDSRPNGLNYFSAEDLQEYQGGVRVRKRVGALRGVASAYVEAGRQKANGFTTPVNGWQIRFESFQNKPWYYDLSIGRQSNADGGAGPLIAGDRYAYRYAKASVVWPL